MSYFSGEDLIFYKEDDKIKSGGFTINSILLKEGLSPMTTYNQSGGKNNNVSSLYDNLAIPAGLLYINHKLNTDCNSVISNNNANTSVLSDDIHDSLFKLIEANATVDNEKKKKLTKKEKKKNKINYTRKAKK